MESMLEALQGFFQGFEVAFTWWNILYCLVGVSVGMLVGVLPGLGPVFGTAILIPLTYGLDPISAIIMLAGIYYGAMYGGTITSVLVNIPGEVASVVTAIDGHQMAKQGRAGTALGVAAIGSFIGGIVAMIAFVLLGPIVVKVALKFGPPEFFALMLFGLMMVVALVGKSLIKGLIAAILGMILAFIGEDLVSGTVRFTFGQLELLDGLDFTVLAIGLFGISEVLIAMENMDTKTEILKVNKLFPEKEEWKPTLKAIARGTGIGVFLGLIPGASAAKSSLISYLVERKAAKDPSRFGKGAIEGVAGPESANNAHSGSAMIPLFMLGIPTSPTVAVLLGAFIIHGLQPGPKMFETNPDLIWGVIASMLIGNIILLLFNLPLAKVWAMVAQVPLKLLLPLILIIALLGAYSVSQSLFDVGLAVFFGILGYFMRKLDIPVAPIILTFVLAREIEFRLAQSLIMSLDKGLLIFFQRPISCVMMILIFVILAINIIGAIRKKPLLQGGEPE